MILTSLQAHLDRLLVKTGDVLHKGDPIGIEGNTGKSSGRHTHHAIIKGKRSATWRQSQTASLGGSEQMIKDWLKAGAYRNGGRYRISTGWGRYKDPWGNIVDHQANDYYAIDDKTLVWPYEQTGRVEFAGGGDSWDYGKHILISWDTEGGKFTMKPITFTGTQPKNVRTAPSLSAPVRTKYNPGETLHYPSEVVIADNHVWVKYISNSGITSYIAIASDPNCKQ